MMEQLLELLGLNKNSSLRSNLPDYANKIQQVMNPQYPGMLTPGNIDLSARPLVKNPKGGTSTVFSMGIGIDGKEYLIPRVSEDGRILTEPEAIKQFKETGHHLGVFDTPENSTNYAKQLHKQQAEFYKDRIK